MEQSCYRPLDCERSTTTYTQTDDAYSGCYLPPDAQLCHTPEHVPQLNTTISALEHAVPVHETRSSPEQLQRIPESQQPKDFTSQPNIHLQRPQECIALEPAATVPVHETCCDPEQTVLKNPESQQPKDLPSQPNIQLPEDLPPQPNIHFPEDLLSQPNTQLQQLYEYDASEPTAAVTVHETGELLEVRENKQPIDQPSQLQPNIHLQQSRKPKLLRIPESKQPKDFTSPPNIQPQQPDEYDAFEPTAAVTAHKIAQLLKVLENKQPKDQTSQSQANIHLQQSKPKLLRIPESKQTKDFTLQPNIYLEQPQEYNALEPAATVPVHETSADRMKYREPLFATDMIPDPRLTIEDIYIEAMTLAAEIRIHRRQLDARARAELARIMKFCHDALREKLVLSSLAKRAQSPHRQCY